MTGGRRLPATAVPKRVSRGKREEQVRAEGIQTPGSSRAGAVSWLKVAQLVILLGESTRLAFESF